MKQTRIEPDLAAAILVAPPVWWWLAPHAGTAASMDAMGLGLAIAVFPILEELSFRGLLQEGLLQWFGRGLATSGLSAANLLTSVAFSAAHLPVQSWSWSAATFLPSLVFGHFREKHDSVLPSIALHVYYNAGLILCAAKFQ